MYPTQCRFMSVLDLLDCEDFSIHQFMVVERNLKAQRFFVTLSVKYGELRRFWNEIPLLTTKKTRKQRLQRQKTIKDQKKAKRRAVALRRASYRSKKKNTTSTRLPPTPEPTPLPMVQPPVPAPGLGKHTETSQTKRADVNGSIGLDNNICPYLYVFIGFYNILYRILYKKSIKINKIRYF